MSRFLLATWDGGGTIPPELGLAAELVARGHEVVVLSDDTVEQEATEAGATFTPWRRAPQARARDAERALIRDWEVRNPLAQVRQVGELLFFGPASLHAADLSDAIDQHSPDVLIVDALLTGASAGAEHSGLPTAAVAPNVNMLRTPGVPPMGSGLRPLGGRVGRAARRRAPPAQRRADGHRHAQRHASRARPRPRRFAGAERPAGGSGHLPDQRGVRLPADAPGPAGRLRRGSRSRRTSGTPVAWTPPWPHDGRPAVLLSLSTTYMQQEDLLQRLVDALGQVDCHALVTTGPGLRSRPLTRVPSNVHVVESAPHGAVLPHVDLVITHGGHGTVIRALAGGVPVMVVPISRDQPDNAARVVHHGVGIKVSKRSSPEKFAGAVRRALADDALHADRPRHGRAVGARHRCPEGRRRAGGPGRRGRPVGDKTGGQLPSRTRVLWKAATTQRSSCSVATTVSREWLTPCSGPLGAVERRRRDAHDATAGDEPGLLELVAHGAAGVDRVEDRLVAVGDGRRGRWWWVPRMSTKLASSVNTVPKAVPSASFQACSICASKGVAMAGGGRSWCRWCVGIEGSS